MSGRHGTSRSDGYSDATRHTSTTSRGSTRDSRDGSSRDDRSRKDPKQDRTRIPEEAQDVDMDDDESDGYDPRPSGRGDRYVTTTSTGRTQTIPATSGRHRRDISPDEREIINAAPERGAPRPVPGSGREFWIPKEGIEREVITYEITRYLGGDALVKPGRNDKGRDGYLISAFRAPTTEMIRSMKEASEKFVSEQAMSQSRRQGPYSSSRTANEREQNLGRDRDRETVSRRRERDYSDDDMDVDMDIPPPSGRHDRDRERDRDRIRERDRDRDYDDRRDDSRRQDRYRDQRDSRDPRDQDSRMMTDTRYQDPRLPDPRLQDSRYMSDPRLMSDPRIQESRMQDPRMADPRMLDSRVQDPRMADPRLQDQRYRDLAYQDMPVTTGRHNPSYPAYSDPMLPASYGLAGSNQAQAYDYSQAAPRGFSGNTPPPPVTRGGQPMYAPQVYPTASQAQVVRDPRTGQLISIPSPSTAYVQESQPSRHTRR